MDTHANAAMAIFSLQKLEFECQCVSVKWSRRSSSTPSSNPPTTESQSLSERRQVQQKLTDLVSPTTPEKDVQKVHPPSPFFDQMQNQQLLNNKNHIFPPGSPQKAQLEMPEPSYFNVQPMWTPASGVTAHNKDDDDNHKSSGPNNHTFEYYHGTTLNL